MNAFQSITLENVIVAVIVAALAIILIKGIKLVFKLLIALIMIGLILYFLF